MTFEEQTSQSTLTKSAKGSVYSIAVSAITILLGFVRSVLLMRLLEPDMFGVVSLAVFFATFLSPFCTLGIDSAVIQHPNPGKETLSTHFVLRLLLALIILPVGGGGGLILRRVYADQVVVVDVFLVLLTVNIIMALFSTPSAILRRDLRFGEIALLNLLASIAMTVTALTLAYLGAGLWSLVAEQLISPIVRLIVIWSFFRPWRFSLRFSRSEAISLVRFGRHVFSANLLGILLDRFDDFWAGTAFGPTSLGYYSRAYEIAQYPERVLATPITNVFFSAYAALQSDARALSKAFFRSSGFLVRAGFLVTAVFGIAIPEITVVLFGKNWLPVVPIFRLMLIYVMLDPLYANLSYLLVGVGHPELLNRVRLIQVLVFIASVIGLAYLWEIQGIAVAADLMMLCGVILLMVYGRRFVRYSLSRMLLIPLIAGVAAVGAGIGVSLVSEQVGIWQMLIFKLLSVSSVYALIVYVAERRIILEYGSEILLPLWKRIHLAFLISADSRGDRPDP
ncbi:MAG: oligosaccharide flippase family protein [Anaerolineae bacterium]|jgi:O-antigen/teichoic acid export membrane protein